MVFLWVRGGIPLGMTEGWGRDPRSLMFAAAALDMGAS